MNQGPIGLQAIWNVKHPEPFKAVAAELSELVQRNEPGAILYHFFLSEDEKTATFHEWYADSASALKHVTGPAATEFMPRFMKSGDVNAFHVYGDVDAISKRSPTCRAMVAVTARGRGGGMWSANRKGYA